MRGVCSLRAANKPIFPGIDQIGGLCRLSQRGSIHIVAGRREAVQVTRGVVRRLGERVPCRPDRISSTLTLIAMAKGKQLSLDLRITASGQAEGYVHPIGLAR